jgi:hypothetical protein
MPRLGVLATHPIQYYAPLYRALAAEVDLTVYFAHLPTAAEQGVGFGVPFTWDTDLTGGYDHVVLRNRARGPIRGRFGDFDTPEMAREIRERRFDFFLVLASDPRLLGGTDTRTRARRFAVGR